jgi:hypothetical protein
LLVNPRLITGNRTRLSAGALSVSSDEAVDSREYVYEGSGSDAWSNLKEVRGTCPGGIYFR